MKKILNILRKVGEVLACIMAGIAIYGIIVAILARFTSWGD